MRYDLSLGTTCNILDMIIVATSAPEKIANVIHNLFARMHA